MNDNAQIKNEDEISLFDLFTVLLRYWRLIAGIPLVLIILAVIGYFIYPIQQYNNAVKNCLVQGRIIVSINQNISWYMSQNLESFINRADVVLDSLREAGMNEFEYANNNTVSLTNEAERARALYIIDQVLILNKSLNGENKKDKDRIFQVITDKTRDVQTVVRDKNTYEILYKNKDQELIKSFFQRLIVHGNEFAKDYIRTYVEEFVNYYEQVMDSPYIVGKSWQDAMGGNFGNYVFYKNFLDGKEIILNVIGEPIITKPDIYLVSFQSSYRLKGVIIVFAGFFLSIVFAFILNVIHNIKNDKEAMKKINDALGKFGDK